ncbi:MAG: adenylosuccinate lyase [bacterium]
MPARYSHAEIQTLWTEETQYRRWLQVEMAVCQARWEAGEIPTDSWLRMQERAGFGSVDEVAQLEKETHHDLVAFLRAVEPRLGEDFRYFHQGLTSQDIKDTTFSLQCQRAGEIISKDIQVLMNRIYARADREKHTIMVGRTHGMQAEPITFGLKLLRFGEEFRRHSKRVENAIAEVSVGKVSGAVGTYGHIPIPIAERACSILGLQLLLVTSQIIPRDIYAYFFSVLALLASSIENVATEIRHLQRTEVAEVEEPFTRGQMGSSAMPHKRNPILCERLCGLSRWVRFQAAAHLENIPSWHERDLSHSCLERLSAPAITETIGYMLQLLANVVEGLQVDPERMLVNMELSYGTVFSESLLLTLVQKGIPRSIASQKVQALAFRALREKTSLRTLIEQDPEIFPLVTECLDHLVSNDSLTHRINEIFARSRGRY